VNATLDRVRGRVAERFPADLERIRDYLRLPSVSATGEGIRAAAEATGAWIEGAGGSFELVETPGHPTDEDERIRVAGLDGAATPGDGDARLPAELAETFDPAEHLREARAARYRLPGGAPELLEALLFRPTLNVSGIAGGYVGPGGKTIVPSRAVALVDIWLVPGGDPGTAAAAVRRHLDRHGFGHVQVRMLESYPWAKAPPGNRAELALRASYQALGRRPLSYPLAPWCAPYYVVDRILGLPWAAGGVGHAAGAHGPDEYVTVAGVQEHVVGAAAFLLAYAAGAGEAPA
jgi:acetylornithine deacetylase/succinyl-diaminopimelate desuccinylase-like protein